MKLKAVLFDFDGTIFKIEVVHKLAIRTVMEKYTGQPVSDDELLQDVGIPYLDRLHAMFRRRGLEDTDGIIESLEKRARGIMRDNEDLHAMLLPGVEEWIRALRNAGVVMGVVTSALEERVAQYFDEVGLSEFFSFIIGLESVTNRKPDPEPYETALAHLNMDKSAVVVFEDSPRGVESARGAGLAVVGVLSTFTAEELPGTSLNIFDYSQLTVPDIEALL